MVFPHTVTSCLFLLFFIFFLLFVYALDFTPLIDLGHFRTTFLDPFATVAQLRSILDERGIEYHGVVEKRELVHLVTDSGGGGNGGNDQDEEYEVGGAGSTIGQTVDEIDQSDRVWTVSGRPGRVKLSQKDRQRIARLGIKIGVVNCEEKRSPTYYWLTELCSHPSLALSVPIQDAGGVRRLWRLMPALLKGRGVLKWIQKELNAGKIRHNARSGDYSVKLVLMSEADTPPLYYDVLTVELAEYAQFNFFGNFDFNSRKQLFNESFLQLQDECLNHLIFMLPGKNFSYGCHPGEEFNYKSLKFHIRVFNPQLQDLLIFSALLLNGYILLSSVVSEDGIVWLRLIKYIIISNSAWIFIIVQLPLSLPAPLLQLWHAAMLSYEGCWLRWLFYRLPSSLIFIAFVLYSSVIWWTSRRFWAVRCFVTDREEINERENDRHEDQLQTETLDDPDFPRIRLTVNTLLHQQHFHSYPYPRAQSSIIVDDHLNALLEELAQHLLTDVESEEESLPLDYIRDLPRWKHRVTTERSKPPSYALLSEQCVVCLMAFRRGQTMCALPCGHVFHLGCVKPWLETRSTMCPVCRSPANKGTYCD